MGAFSFAFITFAMLASQSASTRSREDHGMPMTPQQAKSSCGGKGTGSQVCDTNAKKVGMDTGFQYICRWSGTGSAGEGSCSRKTIAEVMKEENPTKHPHLSSLCKVADHEDGCKKINDFVWKAKVRTIGCEWSNLDVEENAGCHSINKLGRVGRSH
eukprot:symbB.v1.2.031812.t1/scaffold3735.1/size51219/2